ncbi:MAG: hypothetical protein QM758_05595 [Armatimonas sp.]
MERKQFLQLAAVLPLAALVGCGGGGDSGGGGGTVDSIPVDRTVVTGDLKAQIEQFNQATFRLASTWRGTSPALDALKNVTTRALPGVRVPLQATAIGLDGARVTFERLCNQALSLDDVGHTSNTVSTNNNLQGANNLDNPTWLAGMMAQNLASIKVVGALYSIMQVSGLGELQAWVISRPTDAARLTAYAVMASLVNAWIDAVCAATGSAVNPAWKLNVGADVTLEGVAAQFDQLLAVVLALPFGPGARPGGTGDAGLGAGSANFGAALLAALTAQVFPGQSLSTLDPATAHFDLSARLGSAGILQVLAAQPGGVAAAQALVDGWLSSTQPADWPGGDEAAINCQIQIVGTTYNFFNALRASMMESQSAFGTIMLGNQALAAFDAMDAAIATCGSVYQKALWERQACARKVLHDFRFANGSAVTERQVPEVSIAGLELDQVYGGAANRIRVLLCIEVEQEGPGKVRGLDVATSRAVLAGSGSAIPRTFAAVDNAAANLLADLTNRFQVELQGDWKADGSFTFLPSNFASFLRREPGAEFVTIPAITQAALLCSGPGFLPSRTVGDVDLATITSLPILNVMTSIVGGIPIHVN